MICIKEDSRYSISQIFEMVIIRKPSRRLMNYRLPNELEKWIIVTINERKKKEEEEKKRKSMYFSILTKSFFVTLQ